MGPKDEKNYEEATNFYKSQCEALNTHFETNKFLCGNEMTIADIFAFAYMETNEVAGLPLHDFKNVSAWFKAMQDQKFVAGVHQKFGYDA